MQIILGTAGHIDHGKSSLVQALTGINPDRLPEEKSRGVTIELGFAHLTIDNLEIGLIDVPGHADFVNNMVSGVGALDIALFIVAADDGWMPQSEEHLHILNYLGVKNIIIALTKADIAEDIEFTTELVREDLIGTTLENATIIPVSSHTGQGIDELKNEIINRASEISHDSKSLIPRIHVDRAFSPTGVGTVITGTLTGAPLNKGDQLTCLPQNLTATIRNAQNHSKSLPTVQPGTRTALNIPDLPLNQKGKPGVQRGSLLTAPEHITPTSTLDITLTRQKRSITGQSATKRPIKNTETVILHHGTSRTRARIILHDTTTLLPGQTTLAQLRLESPIPACTGDKFVIRDGAQQGTLGGGTILDANATPKQFRTPARAEFLTARAEDPENLRTIILTELHKQPYLNTQKPLPNTPFTTPHFQKTLEQITKQKKALNRAPYIIEPSFWKNTLQSAATLITDYHQQNPDTPTMPLELWRSTLTKKQNLPTDLTEIILNNLLKENFSTKNEGIAHADHSLELPEALQPIAQKILTTLTTSNLTPPPRPELAPDPASQQALTYLIRTGQIIELDPKALLEKNNFENFKQSIIAHLKTHTQATASEIRQATGSVRKVLMPTLELLDAQNITIRNGDQRTLNSNYQ